MTTGQLVARLRKICAEVDPEEAERRYEHAVENRRVVIDPTPFGTANLYAIDLPPDKATAAARRLDRIARSLRRDGEARTMDQLRADTLIDLLCGSATTGAGGTVEIQVELHTLVELNEHSGELAGYGPVIADIARKVVDTNHDAPWRYTVTDNGRPVATGTTRRRPSAAQRRIVEMTHPTCIFPGCRTASTDCDIDHRIEWARSKRTVTDDLAPLCPPDHGGRHTFGWTYRFLPNGDIEWTSPLGRIYTVRGRSP